MIWRSRAGAGGRSLGTITATYAFQHDYRREYDIVRDATTGPQFAFRRTTSTCVEHKPMT
jgi:hypothetical protein